MGWKITTTTNQAEMTEYCQQNGALAQAIVLIGVDDAYKKAFRTNLYEDLRRVNDPAGQNCLVVEIGRLQDVDSNLPAHLLYSTSDEEQEEQYRLSEAGRVELMRAHYLVVDLTQGAYAAEEIRNAVYQRLRLLDVERVTCIYLKDNTGTFNMHGLPRSRAVDPEAERVLKEAKNNLSQHPPVFCKMIDALIEVSK